MTPPDAPDPSARLLRVHALRVETGRSPEDGLPEDATGALIFCHAEGADEAEAVREAVAVLKRAGLAPLRAESLGTIAERERAGETITAAERALMQRALDENSVIVSHVVPLDA